MLKVRGIICVCGLVCGFSSVAEAQLFGPRSLGGPLQSRRGAAAAATLDDGAGTLQGNERFLRDNRSRNAFVGSNRGSLQGFVGSSQAIGVGRVPAATESLTPPPDRSATINRPMPRLPANTMYYPRLVIDFDVASGGTSSGTFASGEADQVLSSRLSRIAEQAISVRRRGDVVVLEGTVESVAMAEKLAIIASFEPQVETIENRIVVGR